MNGLLRILFLLPGLLLASCAANWGQSPSAALLDGARLDIRRPLPVAAEQRSIRFQHGRPIDQRHATVWEEQCRLILAKPADRAGEIGQGSYRVSRVTENDIPLSRFSFVRHVRLQLETVSGRPAEALECERAFEIPLKVDERRELLPADIGEALGDWIRLVPPDRPEV